MTMLVQANRDSLGYKRRAMNGATSLPNVIINSICTYLRARDLAHFSSTEKRIDREVKNFVVEKWNGLGVDFPSNKNYKECTRLYFQALIKDVISYIPPWEREVSFVQADWISPQIRIMDLSLLRQLKILEDLEKRFLSNQYIFRTLQEKCSKRFYETGLGFSKLPIPLISEGKFFQLMKTYKPPQIDNEETKKMGYELLQHALLIESNYTFCVDIDLVKVLLQNGADPYAAQTNPFYKFLEEIIHSDKYSYEFLKPVMDLAFEQGIDMDVKKGDRTAFKLACLSLRRATFSSEEYDAIEGVSDDDELASDTDSDESDSDYDDAKLEKAMKTIKYLLAKDTECLHVKLSCEGRNEANESMPFEMSVLEVVQETLGILVDSEEHREIVTDLREIIQLCTPNTSSEDARAKPSSTEE